MNAVCSMMADRLSVTRKKNRNAATVALSAPVPTPLWAACS